MRRAILMVLLLSYVLSLLACKLVDKLSKSGSSSSSSSSPSTSSSSSSGSIGVSECDDYIRAYKSCLSQIPAENRATFESALEQNVSIWRQYAASPERRAGLAEACQEARDTTANSLQAYGCSF